MKDIYVIVHEADVNSSVNVGLEEAISAQTEIARIKIEEETRLVDGRPILIPQNMPPPDDCKVYVCGSATRVCVEIQKLALVKEGYNATVHKPGSVQPPSL